MFNPTENADIFYSMEQVMDNSSNNNSEIYRDRFTNIDKECSNCHVLTDIDDLTPWNKTQNLICKECIKVENLVVCDHCGVASDKANIETITVDGTDMNICSKCMDEYSVCEECGEYFHMDDLEYINDSFYCYNCFRSNFVQCTRCNEIVNIEEAQQSPVDNNYYCTDCFESTHASCCSCGDMFFNDDLCYDDNSEEYYCSNCYNELEAERDDCDDLLDEHHTNHNFKIMYGDDTFNSEEEKRKIITTGIEIEIDRNHPSDRDTVADIIAPIEDFCFFEKDGSLDNGFEIITHPFTLNSWESIIRKPLQEALSIASRHSYHSHDTSTCGLHVHVGRKCLGRDEKEIGETIVKLWLLIFRFSPNLVIFSRRKASAIRRWAEMPMFKDLDINSLKDLDNENDVSNLWLKLKDNGSEIRYKALNLQPSRTIEIRIFRGTMNISTITATIQLVNKLVEYARDKNKDNCLNVTWEEFVLFATKDFIELTEYLKVKRLYDTKTPDARCINSTNNEFNMNVSE